MIKKHQDINLSDDQWKRNQYLEPVHGAAGQQCRVPPEPGPETPPTGTHAQGHVELFSNPCHKHLPQRSAAAVRLVWGYGF